MQSCRCAFGYAANEKMLEYFLFSKSSSPGTATRWSPTTTVARTPTSPLSWTTSKHSMNSTRRWLHHPRESPHGYLLHRRPRRPVDRDDDLPAQVTDQEIVEALRDCFDGEAAGDVELAPSLSKDGLSSCEGMRAYEITDEDGLLYRWDPDEWLDDVTADGWHGERWSEDCD